MSVSGVTRPLIRVVLGVALMLAVPAIARAQASITGVVRDTSGALLPGVTIEATSPALIERVRSVTTDGIGQFKIVDLRPGTYVVTFTLSGFTTVKREGIQLTGSFAATLNVELPVGSLSETITVAKESPIVDLQNVTQQRVLNHDVIDAIPTGKYHYNLAVLTPGVILDAANGRLSQDVGGSVGDIQNRVSIHGGRPTDMRVALDGLSMSSGDGAGEVSGLVPNMASTQEVTLNLAAVSAEQTGGGIQFNLIPREGGNRFTGTFFATGVNSSFQGNNITQELLDRKLTGRFSIKNNYDINPGFGGPVVHDKVWFYGAARWSGVHNYVANAFQNANAGDPGAWTYVKDESRPGVGDADWRSVNGRVTWQASRRNKFSLFYDNEYRCLCLDLRLNTAPEAAFDFEYPDQHFTTVTWSSPLTNRLLFEAGYSYHPERYRQAPPEGADLSLIQVLEQSSGLLYRGSLASGGTPFLETFSGVSNVRASMSYVTGTHAIKVGFSDKHVNRSLTWTDNDANLSYRVNNSSPNQLTERATPYSIKETINAELGVFAQDQWTHKSLTVTLGVRFDYLNIGFPAQSVGPAPLVPNRNLSFPEQSFVNWKDVTPRMGVSYDLFHNGKTALKATLNRYLTNVGLLGSYGDNGNPIFRLANTVTRSWIDNDRDFVPDCDLLSSQAQGPTLAGSLQTVDTCGALSNSNFGNPTPSTTYDPDAIIGFGQRPDNWELSTSVQQEMTPRVSLSVGYFRRWYGNFTVIDNTLVGPSNYSPFSVTAPVDARLPDGGGQTISGLYDLNQDKVGQVANYFTLASKFGKQIEHWNGVDASVNARIGRGMLLQGGISSGRTVTDNCDVVTKVDNPSTLYCHQDSGMLTQVKALAAYTIPTIDVQVSGTVQSIPGPRLAANVNVLSAAVQPSLGRPLSGGAATVTVNVVEPGLLYGDRLNQLDLRVSKLFTFARYRTRFNADLYNALNGAPVLQENSNYAVWRTPLVVQQARVAKLSVQLDF